MHFLNTRCCLHRNEQPIARHATQPWQRLCLVPNDCSRFSTNKLCNRRSVTQGSIVLWLQHAVRSLLHAVDFGPDLACAPGSVTQPIAVVCSQGLVLEQKRWAHYTY